LSTEANLESNSRTRLDHKTLGNFRPKLTPQQFTTAIFILIFIHHKGSKNIIKHIAVLIASSWNDSVQSPKMINQIWSAGRLPDHNVKYGYIRCILVVKYKIYIQCVAALPCEIQTFKNSTNCAQITMKS